MIRDDKRIESIRLVGVGPFKNTTLNFPTNSRKDLAEVHIFTGGNGEGKSTLLYALAAHFSSKGETKSIDEIAKRMRNKNAFVTCKSFEDVVEMSRNLHPSRYGIINSEIEEVGDISVYRSKKFKDIVRKWRSKNWRNNNYSVLPIAYSGGRAWGLSLDIADTSLQEVTQSPLKDHLSFADTIDPWTTAQWIANIEVKQALASKKDKKAKLKKSKEAVVQLVREIIDQKVDFYLNPETLQVQLMLQGKPVSIDVLPDGLKSILSWIADILMRMDRLPWENKHAPVIEQPLILFLDEIDIHLHPKWQARVLPAVQKLFPNAQIFVSTHSPFVVASVEDAWVYEMSRGGKNSNGSFVVKAEKSSAGKSYELVLTETFDITEPFVDPETNRLLDAMRAERDAFFVDKAHSPLEFLRVTDLLAQRSEQLARIVGLECRQLAKHGIDLTVTKS